MRDATPAPSRTFPPAPRGFYRVQAGDTLYQIAFAHGLDFQDLAAWNRFDDPDHILAGSTLRLSAPKSPVAVARLPARPSVHVQSIPPQPTPLSELSDEIPDLWTWPSKGDVLTRFGDGLSKGIDIAGRRGQIVLAAARGRVVYAGSGLRGYGKLIIIRHGRTLLSAYAHNDRILVNEGQEVARGQAIGEMGDTDADRIKLHFEIRAHGKPVDPMQYLPNAG